MSTHPTTMGKRCQPNITVLKFDALNVKSIAPFPPWITLQGLQELVRCTRLHDSCAAYNDPTLEQQDNGCLSKPGFDAYIWTPACRSTLWNDPLPLLVDATFVDADDKRICPPYGSNVYLSANTEISLIKSGISRSTLHERFPNNFKKSYPWRNRAIWGSADWTLYKDIEGRACLGFPVLSDTFAFWGGHEPGYGSPCFQPEKKVVSINASTFENVEQNVSYKDDSFWKTAIAPSQVTWEMSDPMVNGKAKYKKDLVRERTRRKLLLLRAFAAHHDWLSIKDEPAMRAAVKGFFEALPVGHCDPQNDQIKERTDGVKIASVAARSAPQFYLTAEIVTGIASSIKQKTTIPFIAPDIDYIHRHQPPIPERLELFGQIPKIQTPTVQTPVIQTHAITTELPNTTGIIASPIDADSICIQWPGCPYPDGHLIPKLVENARFTKGSNEAHLVEVLIRKHRQTDIDKAVLRNEIEESKALFEQTDSERQKIQEKLRECREAEQARAKELDELKQQLAGMQKSLEEKTAEIDILWEVQTHLSGEIAQFQDEFEQREYEDTLKDD